MHPIIFAVFGFIALSLAATFLGYFFGLAFLVADFAKSNPKRVSAELTHLPAVQPTWDTRVLCVLA